MKKTTSWKTILSCCLAATLALAALGCAEEEEGNNEGPASTAGTNCPEIVCDATGSVKTGPFTPLFHPEPGKRSFPHRCFHQ